MASPDSVLLDRVLSTARSNAVATEAGVTAGTASGQWGATDGSGHVFAGLVGLRGGRTRFRAPFLEVMVESLDITEGDEQSSMLDQLVRIRVWVAGGDLDAAADQAGGILAVAIAQLRDDATDELATWGSERIEPLSPGHRIHSREASIVVNQSLDRGTYGVT